jgi:hypothetical protein
MERSNSSPGGDQRAWSPSNGLTGGMLSAASRALPGCPVGHSQPARASEPRGGRCVRSSGPPIRASVLHACSRVKDRADARKTGFHTGSETTAS